MVSNKKRLYVALYPSGVPNNEERKYHWAFLIGPKIEKGIVPGVRCHVKNPPIGGWVYEEADLDNVQTTTGLLARMIIAKIEDEEQLFKILRETPVVQDDPNFRCRTWMGHALERLSVAEPRAVGTAELNWDTIQQTARRYVGEKTASGRYAEASRLRMPKPTWDMMEHKETIE